MHARKTDRNVIARRVSASALTRAVVLLTLSGCRAAEDAIVVRPDERVVGRAVASGRVVLLTDAPALISIDPDRRVATRLRVARDSASRKLWGLGETDGVLYSVEGFSDLTRLNADGTRTRAATFERPLGNLLDTHEGMAGQIALDGSSTPLVWSVGSNGSLQPIAGAVRQPHGVSRAEEGVLHLLSCSLPPRVVCWLPGVPQLFAFEGRRIDARMQLESVDGVIPVRLLERPDMKVIQDAFMTEQGTIVAAIRIEPARPATSLEEFAADGRHIRRIPAAAQIRVLLGTRAGQVLAITASGRLLGLPL